MHFVFMIYDDDDNGEEEDNDEEEKEEEKIQYAHFSLISKRLLDSLLVHSRTISQITQDVTNNNGRSYYNHYFYRGCILSWHC